MADGYGGNGGFVYRSIVKAGISAMESNILPDFLVRRATRLLLSSRLRDLHRPSVEQELHELMKFVHSLKEMPIAINTSDANSQHYQVPTEFYKLVLGKHLKYSCAYFMKDDYTLDQAEEAMLNLYCERAKLEDGQTILDLGCGWGSLSLYIAQKYTKSQITSVSNSTTQRDFIQEECTKKGFTNINVIVCDVNAFEAPVRSFDRVLSIEMFEHMKNYQKLLKNISSWMKTDGLLFVHIFCHKNYAYHFEDAGDDDWMARSFFTGGTMPADQLLLYFQEDVSILNHWRLNGTHYSQTSEAWLKRMDQNMNKIVSIFAKAYAEKDANKWVAYWRTFFIAVSEMFNYNNGQEWMVSHYLFKPS